MCEYIDTLTPDDDPHRDFLRSMLAEILDRSLSIIVVRMRPGLLEKRRYKHHVLVRGRSVVLLSFAGQDQVPQVMRLIKSIRPLHITEMHILIGTAELPAVLREQYESSRLTDRVARLGDWPAKVKEHILGGLDPLDGDINIAGTPVIRKIMNAARKMKGRTATY
jgi:hypothetical protein